MAILPTRTSSDTNSVADINELSGEALDKGGTSQLSALTEDVAPASGSWFLMETAAGALRKVDTDNMPGGGAGGIVALQGQLRGNAYVADNIFWLRASAAFTISKVRIGAVTPPTGASLIVDVNYHATNPDAPATTIFTTQANRPEIAINGHTDDSGTPDITDIADGGWLGICIDQIGSTLPGTNIIVEIIV
jgi:hypothetical protein